MMWVALDRGLRLADKRVLPCPNRMKWLETRDKLYEEIQEKGWNSEKKFFSQSYEMKESLDSAVCELPHCDTRGSSAEDSDHASGVLHFRFGPSVLVDLGPDPQDSREGRIDRQLFGICESSILLKYAT
jgi:hypothetical protein